MKRRCYYEVLQISLTATLSEIRHSYHKLAKKWHPDKNQTAIAKQYFQEINQAYSVLSDPREKTFYDRHRETIVRNWNAGTQTSDVIPENENMLTNTEHFWPFFIKPAYLGYDDSEEGFYSVYRRVFDTIKSGVEVMNALVHESEHHREIVVETQSLIVRAPSFGDSETKLVNVAQFYVFWEDLPNVIETAWKDLSYSKLKSQEHLIPEEDFLEREGIQEKYIDIIRSLVMYVKMHDPRYHQYLESKNSLKATEEEHKEDEKVEPQDQMIIEKVLEPFKCFHDFERCEECWSWTIKNLDDILKFKFQIPKNGKGAKKELLQLPMSDEDENEEKPQIVYNENIEESMD